MKTADNGVSGSKGAIYSNFRAIKGAVLGRKGALPQEFVRLPGSRDALQVPFLSPSPATEVQMPVVSQLVRFDTSYL
jgi:hypothetical protein